MRRTLSLAAALLALLAVAASGAWAAGSAHFIKNASSATLSGQSLACKFKEAGLASGSVETVTCSATQTIVYECVNNGGKNPSASNKQSFTREHRRLADPAAAERRRGRLQLPAGPDGHACLGQLLERVGDRHDQRGVDRPARHVHLHQPERAARAVGARSKHATKGRPSRRPFSCAGVG